MDDTIRKVEEFRGELVALGKLANQFPPIDSDLHLDRRDIFVGIKKFETSLDAYHVVSGLVRRSKAADKIGQPFTGKLQGRGYHFFNFAKAFIITGRGKGGNIGRFRSKEITRCVDAIDAQVAKGATAHFFFQADVRVASLHAKIRIEIAKFPELARSQKLDGFKI